jgi:hypothetical protein
LRFPQPPFSLQCSNAFKSGDLNDHRILFAFIGLIYSLDYETEKNGIKGEAS